MSEPSAAELLARALRLEATGDLRAAAAALDQAWGGAPDDAALTAARGRVLDALAVVEHGIRFRYVPAGPFLMGSSGGEPDEQPVHRVEVAAFWLGETPVSWARYCDLMGWEPPPAGRPREPIAEEQGFFRVGENQLRLQYCEDGTLEAHDWHAHLPDMKWTTGSGEAVTSRQIFGEVKRADPRQPVGYDAKPMVAVSWQEAGGLAARLSTPAIGYRLPTEAEWEKAARGGRVQCRHAWGDEPPSAARCDFDRFEQFSILPARRFPPNGYGLYAMNGGVWEWTADWYDAEYYRDSPAVDPTGPATGEEKVLRGGSWTDCAEVVTTSFRMSRGSGRWPDRASGGHVAPNLGFRLCRVERGADPAARR